MNISLSGNPRALQITGATELPSADGAAARGTPRVETPNLTVTEAPQSPTDAGIPPAELEKALSRDDGLGKLFGKGFSSVSTAAVDAFVAGLLK